MIRTVSQSLRWLREEFHSERFVPTLQDRYRIDAELGRGARSVGAVYRTMDSQAGGLVAVKVLNPRADDRRRAGANTVHPDHRACERRHSDAVADRMIAEEAMIWQT